MEYLLGIDIGTSSVKSLLTDLDGQPIALSSQSYPVRHDQADHAEQDPERWWSAACRTIRDVLARSGVDPTNIKGIGLSGQMHGLVVLDSNGQPVRPAIIWMDSRTKDTIKDIHDLIGEEAIADLTLNKMAAGFLIASLYWLKMNEPENYDRTAVVLLPKDYLCYRLSGELGTDWTDACGTLAFDPRQRQWSQKLLDKLSIDVKLFPDVHPPFAVAGTIQKPAALATGLHQGTPVAYGGGDNAMQNIGNGLVDPGSLSINIGTGAQLSLICDQPIRDPRIRTNTFCYAMDKRWSIVGASLSGGGTLKWFKENLAKTENFQNLDHLARQVNPCADGLLFLPYLSGERTPYFNPHARGVLFGLNHTHGTPHIARAIMEGVVFALRGSLDILYQLGLSVHSVVASGGGAKSQLWLQIQADIFDQEIRVAQVDEQACLGAAIMAAVAAGIYQGIPEACRQMVSYKTGTISPIQQNVSVYQYYYELFNEIYQRNVVLFEKLDVPGGK